MRQEASNPLPGSVQAFLRRHIRSASMLDVLLTVRTDPDRGWQPEHIGRVSRLGAAAASHHLVALATSGLVQRRGDAFHYAAPPDEEPAIAQLALVYIRQPHTVVRAIFEQPIDRAED